MSENAKKNTVAVVQTAVVMYVSLAVSRKLHEREMNKIDKRILATLPATSRRIAQTA